MERRETMVSAHPHQLILQERNRLELSGVLDVDSFDEDVVCCRTSQGQLTVCGNGLHMQRLDLEGTSLSIEGHIDSLQYTELRKGGFFGRLLR